jgi:pyrroloquinoline quinone biosynthesis protein E
VSGGTNLVLAPQYRPGRNGSALSCRRDDPGLAFDRVTEKPLRAIWYDGSAFNAFRGHAWMKEPGRSCARRDKDHGGCRCQAMALSGDATAADPVCRHASGRSVIDSILSRETAFETGLIYRATKTM